MIVRYWSALSSGGPLTVLAIASGLALIGLIFYPLAILVERLFFPAGMPSLAAFATAFEAPELLAVLRNTLIYVVVSGSLALAIGGLLAWLSERTDASLGWASSAVPLVPLFLPGLAGVIGWVLLCAPRTGYLNVAIRRLTGSSAETGPFDIFSLEGMVFVTAVHLVPYAYLAIASALRNLDASFEEASRMSGAGVLRTVTRISLPMVTPAIISGTILVFMSVVTAFSIPAVLGGAANFTVLSFRIYELVNVVFPARIDEALVLSFIGLSIIQILMWVQLSLGFRRYQAIGAGGLRRVQIPLRALRLPARALISLYFLAAAILPLAGLLLVSFLRFWTPNLTPQLFTMENYALVFDLGANVPFMPALRNSSILAVLVAIINMVIATILAYNLARSQNLITRALDVVASLPAVIPHIVLGLAFLLAFTRGPLILYGTIYLIFLAYIAMYMPQAMQFAKFMFGQISPELPEASRVFGGSEGRTFLRILVPLVLPSAISGAIVISTHVMTEINGSIMVASVGTVVVGPTLYTVWNSGSNVPPVAAFAVVISAVSALLALASMYIGRVVSLGRERA